MTASYKSDGADGPGRRASSPTGTPASRRELRAQGRRTMRRLLDAGLEVFAARGYHAARVDDIVRAARTSHGTFYLYFANKEDLLRALATECADDLGALAGTIGPIGPDEAGRAELAAFVERFLRTYHHYGPVIRAWTDDQIGDREIGRLGMKAFTAVGDRLGLRMREANAAPVPNERAAVAALMAMLERMSYGVESGRFVADEETLVETLTTVVHRGFFAASG